MRICRVGRKQKMAKKDPHQRALTRQRIEIAYWEIYTKNTRRPVTVSAVVEHAGIHRSTFYEHFQDAAQVLESIEIKLIEEISSHVLGTLRPCSSRNPIDVMQSLYEAHGSQISFLLGPNGDPEFTARVKTTLLPVITPFLDLDTDSSIRQYQLEFLSSGILAVVSSWYNRGCDLNIGALGEIVQHFLRPFAEQPIV